MSEVVYMMVSKPPYLLPEAVCDTVVELAKIAGVSENSIYSIMSRNKRRGYEGRYIKITLDEEEVCQ